MKYHWEQHMPACLSVCLSVFLALKIPALRARQPQNWCPRCICMHADMHMCTRTDTHNGLFYPTLLIRTPLFIRKTDSKATRSSEKHWVCVSSVYTHAVCVSVSSKVLIHNQGSCVSFLVNPLHGCVLSKLFPVLPSVYMCSGCRDVYKWTQCQVLVTLGADLCYSNAVCPRWVFLWKLSHSLRILLDILESTAQNRKTQISSVAMSSL